MGSHCQKVQNELDVNGFLRLNMTRMAISNDIKLDLLPRVILRKKALIIKRHFFTCFKERFIKNHYDFSSSI